jgi:predicted Zn-dependent peptidase
VIHRAAFLALLLGALAAPAGAEIPTIRLPECRTVKLPNGVTLLLAERREVPLIAFHAMLRGGSLTDPPGKEGVAELTARLLRKGAGGRTAREIADTVDGAGARLETGAGIETSDLEGEFLSRDVSVFLGLLADLLRSPMFPPEEFQKAKQQSIDALAAEKDDPAGVLGMYGLAFFYGPHPYARPLGGDEASLRAITRDDVLACYRSQYGADRLILALVGDFDPPAMESDLRAALGGWTAATGTAPIPPEPPRRAGRRVLLVDKPGATQSYFWIGNLGVSRTDPDRVALDLANTAFGGRYTSMLNTELRVRSGLTYGASCRMPRWLRAGTVAITSFTKIESTGRAVDLALGTLDSLRRRHVSAGLLASAKAYVEGQTPPRFQTCRAIASALVDLERFGLPPDEVRGYLGRVAATDSAAVARAIARVYPPAGDLTFVFIGDASKLRTVVRKYGRLEEIALTTPLTRALR